MRYEKPEPMPAEPGDIIHKEGKATHEEVKAAKKVCYRTIRRYKR